MTEQNPHTRDEAGATGYGRVATPEHDVDDPTRQERPDYEPAEEHSQEPARDDEGRDGPREDLDEEWEDAPPHRATPPALAAEAFALAGAALSVIALLGSRMVEILSSVVAADQLGAIANTIIGDGILALAGLLLGGIALLRANETTQPWARWLATAAVITGLVGLVAAAVAYPLVPPPQPQVPLGP